MKHLLRKIWREIKPIALILLIAAPLRSAVVDWNWVPTGSMKPTIMEGDLVLVNKVAYDLKIPFTKTRISTWANPSRGDIAVLFSPKDGIRLVKRIIGLPGDTIELRGDVLFVNGIPREYTFQNAAQFSRDIFEDSHPIIAVEHLGSCDHWVMALPGRTALRNFGPYVVPPETYFVMGDSRDNSFDSRFFGPVPRESIVGKASMVILSFDTSRHMLPRFMRFAHSLYGVQTSLITSLI